LKKNNYADSTIKSVRKSLEKLARYCNLNKPDEVKTFLATFDGSNDYKRILANNYDLYVKYYGLKWEKPKYHQTAKMPKIPLESQIDSLIAFTSRKLATAISISKDTGLRPIELTRLKLKDINLANGAVYPQTAKHGSPKVLKLSNKTLNLLNEYLATKDLNNEDNLFGKWNSDEYGKRFRGARNNLAKKLGDKSIKTIRLYDLRHFFATMLYQKTRDILFVKQQMGHKKIENTLKYTQLLQFEKDDNYTCKVAQNVEQATELIENGFEYVTEMDGLKLFRKRK